MSDRVEVLGEIDVDHDVHPSQNAGSHFRQCSVLRSFRPKSVGVVAKVSLEDCLQDRLQCPLHHAVTDARDLKHSDFVVPLCYFMPSVGSGLVSS